MQPLRQLADAQINVELDTGDMILNLGPQHPATHGTLRLVVRLDGERVLTADPIIGYMHRGYEKLTEYRTYPQVTTLINRIDWLSSFANEVPFVHAAEQLLEVEAPERAQTIRAILTELSRISTFILFLGEMALQVGALTPAFYGFRDREYVLNLIEGVTGGRFHPNFNRIGGLKDDLPWGWISETRDVMHRMLKSCDDYERLVAGNEIFQARTKGVGIIPGTIGAATGCPDPTCVPVGLTGTCVVMVRKFFPTTRSTGKSSRIRMAIATPVTWSDSKRRVSPARWCCSGSMCSPLVRS